MRIAIPIRMRKYMSRKNTGCSVARNDNAPFSLNHSKGVVSSLRAQACPTAKLCEN